MLPWAWFAGNWVWPSCSDGGIPQLLHWRLCRGDGWVACSCHITLQLSRSCCIEGGAKVTLGRLQLSRMDENLSFFADAVGACERILRTPIPLSWTRRVLSLNVYIVASLYPEAMSGAWQAVLRLHARESVSRDLFEV